MSLHLGSRAPTKVSSIATVIAWIGWLTIVALCLLLIVSPGIAQAATTSPPAPVPTTRPGSVPTSSGPLGDYSLNARLVTTACQTAPVGSRVLVVGDSLTVRSATALTATLQGSGWSVCLDARSGQPTEAALDYFPDAFPAWADVIVMATGSNDVFDPDAMPSQVARAKAMAGARPLLWISSWVNRAGSRYRQADLGNSVRVNRALVGVGVIDWYGFLARKATRQAAYLCDGVHPTTAGAAARSLLLLQSLNRLA